VGDFFDPNIKIHGANIQAVIRLQGELENPVALMKKLGAMVLGASQQAFKLQRFGDIPWAARYPAQKPPKLNIAGAVKDFAEGRKAPKPNRFFDRPALIDEGMRGGLQGSLTYRAVHSLSFEVGTIKRHAWVHQHGGITTQQITKPVRDGIRGFLKKKSHSIGRGLKVKPSDYESKLAPLLRKRVLRTHVGARPFVGIHAELWGDMLRAVEEHYKGLVK